MTRAFRLDAWTPFAVSASNRQGQYSGMTLDEAVIAIGKPPLQTAYRLSTLGYHRQADGRYRLAPSAIEVEDAIAARIAAAPPSAPCFRCGGRVCACNDRRAS